MKIIEKKIWPDMYDKDIELTVDFRLADFDLHEGDQILFREWNPQTEQYTGRSYVKTVKQAIICKSPTRYWTQEQMEEHGMYLIEWEK